MKLLNSWNPNNPWKTSLILIPLTRSIANWSGHSQKSSGALQMLPLPLETTRWIQVVPLEPPGIIPGGSRWFQVIPGVSRCFRVIQIFVARGSDLQQEGSFSVTLSIPPLALSSTCPLPSAASNFILKSGNLICFGFFLQWHGEKRKLCWNRNLHILSILASHPASQPLN